MQMNALIPMMGQAPDVVGSLRQGNALAGETKALQRQNALDTLYKEQGAGILAGDQNALNALAGIDPGAALGVRKDQAQMRHQEATLSILNAQERREAEKYAATLSDAERKAMAAKTEEAIKFGLALPDEAAWNSHMSEVAPDLVGKWHLRQAYANRFREVTDILKGMTPSETSAIVSGAAAAELGLDPKFSYNVTQGPGGVKATKIGGGDTNISVGLGGTPEPGKLSPDYAYVTDPETRQPVIDPQTGLPKVAPIPGSPAAREAEAAAEKGGQRSDMAGRAAGVVLEGISRAKSQIKGFGATGFIGQRLAGVGGTAAHDLQQTLMTVRANVGFDRLQQMREASPTGGALGAITERELATLQSVLGSLEQSQSAEQLAHNLDLLEQIYSDIAAKAAVYPNADQFGFSAGVSPPATPPTVGGSGSPPAGVDPAVWSDFERYAQ